jgi:hypothetical protein
MTSAIPPGKPPGPARCPIEGGDEITVTVLRVRTAAQLRT